MAVERMRSSDNICELSKELGLSRTLLYRWRDHLTATPPDEISGGETTSEDARQTRLREENCHLKRALAEKGLEVDFFKAALQKVAARRQQSKASGERASTTRSGK
jgi:transposase-like protein